MVIDTLKNSNQTHTGQFAVVSSYVEKQRDSSGRYVTWRELRLKEPQHVLVLGWVHVYNGRVEKGHYDYDADYQEPNYFCATETIKAYRVQPVENNGRWRKPFTVLKSQLKFYNV